MAYKVVLRLEGDNGGVDARMLADTLRAIEDAQLDVVRTQLALIAENPQHFGVELTDVDAARFRLSKKSTGALRVTRVEQGSVVAELMPIALALWLLKNTFGSSVKEAWQRTDGHRKLVELLTKNEQDVADFCRSLRRRLGRFTQRIAFVVAVRDARGQLHEALSPQAVNELGYTVVEVLVRPIDPDGPPSLFSLGGDDAPQQGDGLTPGEREDPASGDSEDEWS